jgi:branched-subunit amino acid transport protein
MNTTLWLTLLSIAIGTYLLRLLPYLWMRQKLAKHRDENVTTPMPTWLTILGPTMIAAMFGSSLVPSHLDPLAWLATAIGILTTFLVWTRTRSMGWPILMGVVVFGGVKTFMS